MTEELHSGQALSILFNTDCTKLFCVFHLAGDRRVLIPVSLENAAVEKYSYETHSYVPDNLSTIEYQAKQKGLV